jgi:hypothetical protein
MLSILTNNNHLYNYYELFEIINTSSTKQIIKAYQNKIMNYNNENLSQIQINDIKILKMGLYILLTPDLRIIYDHLLNEPGEKVKTFSSARLSEKSKDFLDNEPSSFESLDSKSRMLLNNSPKGKIVNDQLKCNQENNEQISISPAELGDTQGVSSFKTEYAEGNSLDALFNIDNTWKDKITINTSNEKDSGYKKTQNKTDIITNRIFSMAEFNKKPDFPSDFETELRKPLQGRVEKKQL